MGHIKEPKEVDFLIKSEPLNDEKRKKISEFIKEHKSKRRAKKTASNKRRKSKNI